MKDTLNHPCSGYFWFSWAKFSNNLKNAFHLRMIIVIIKKMKSKDGLYD